MRKTDSPSERYIIDSYGWIEYFSNGKLADEYAKYIEKSKPENYFTPTIIIYEVYKKMRSMYSEEDSIKAIAHIESYTTIIDIDIKLAAKGAESSLDEKLPMADAIIRATANSMNAKIITSDKHFKGIENVMMIS